MTNETAEILFAGRYLVLLLKASLHELMPPELPEGLSWEQIFQMAKKHGVETMAGQAAFRTQDPPDPELFARWNKSIDVNIAKNMVQRTERDRILNTLTERQIDVLPLKGCLMIEMYPRPDQRQMSDLDILIRCGDRPAVRDCMKDLGYEVVRYEITNEDTYSKVPFMHVEMHHALFEKTSFHESFKQYYSDPWCRGIPDEKAPCRYHFRWEDYYIYQLAHFYKHFYGGGCGIRNVMDIQVFLEQHGKDLDEEYLTKELCRLDLSDFREKMESLAHQWFALHIDGEPIEENMEETLFSSCAYGLRDNSRRAGLQRLEEKYPSMLMAKTAYILSLLFPSYDRLIIQHPKLKGYPKILPLMWIYHIGYKILFDRERITGNIRVLREFRDDQKKEG